MNDIYLLSILRTLTYGDIFNYPMTASEMYRFLISPIKIPFTKFKRLIKVHEKYFAHKDGYYFLLSRDSICNLRRERMAASRKKLDKARLIVAVLGRIPTLYVIGVSGSVAVCNAKEKDDIDLFFITAPHTLWISRLLVNITLFLIGQKRKRGVRIAADKICPNMYMRADRLKLYSKNLFAAHEVAQLLVLVNKKNTYERFVAANDWVENYLPNVFNFRSIRNVIKDNRRMNWIRLFVRRILLLLIKKIDYIFYKLQYYYMLPYKHNERVSIDSAFFHPKDKTLYVLNLYRFRYFEYIFKLVMLKKVTGGQVDRVLENYNFSRSFNTKN